MSHQGSSELLCPPLFCLQMMSRVGTTQTIQRGVLDPGHCFGSSFFFLFKKIISLSYYGKTHTHTISLWTNIWVSSLSIVTTSTMLYSRSLEHLHLAEPKLYARWTVIPRSPTPSCWQSPLSASMSLTTLDTLPKGNCAIFVFLWWLMSLSTTTT